MDMEYTYTRTTTQSMKKQLHGSSRLVAVDVFYEIVKEARKEYIHDTCD